jgi:hypothetical protein
MIGSVQGAEAKTGHRADVGKACGRDVINYCEKSNPCAVGEDRSVPLFRRCHTHFELRHNKAVDQGISGSLILCDGVRI